jgi:hypothetical protein
MSYPQVPSAKGSLRDIRNSVEPTSDIYYHEALNGRAPGTLIITRNSQFCQTKSNSLPQSWQGRSPLGLTNGLSQLNHSSKGNILIQRERRN